MELALFSLPASMMVAKYLSTGGWPPSGGGSAWNLAMVAAAKRRNKAEREKVAIAYHGFFNYTIVQQQKHGTDTTMQHSPAVRRMPLGLCAASLAAPSTSPLASRFCSRRTQSSQGERDSGSDSA